MTFIRQKRVKAKNGKVYGPYFRRQKSVWVNGSCKSIDMGKANEEADRLVETALRSAARQAKQVEQWQREKFGETAVERDARQAKENEWTQAKFLADTQKEAPAETGAAASPEVTPTSET